MFMNKELKQNKKIKTMLVAGALVLVFGICACYLIYHNLEEGFQDYDNGTYRVGRCYFDLPDDYKFQSVTKDGGAEFEHFSTFSLSVDRVKSATYENPETWPGDTDYDFNYNTTDIEIVDAVNHEKVTGKPPVPTLNP